MEHKMATIQSPVPQHINSIVFFHFKPPTFTYASTWKRKNLENYYKYLGNEEIYYIVKTCCIISIFSQNTINFILLPSSVQTILMFSINKALKIYIPTWLFKGKIYLLHFCKAFYMVFNIMTWKRQDTLNTRTATLRPTVKFY